MQNAHIQRDVNRAIAPAASFERATLLLVSASALAPAKYYTQFTLPPPFDLHIISVLFYKTGSVIVAANLTMLCPHAWCRGLFLLHWGLPDASSYSNVSLIKAYCSLNFQFAHAEA